MAKATLESSPSNSMAALASSETSILDAQYIQNSPNTPASFTSNPIWARASSTFSTSAIAAPSSSSYAVPHNFTRGGMSFDGSPDNGKGWLYSSTASGITWWLIIFSIFSLLWFLCMWAGGGLDWKLNYRRRGDRIIPGQARRRPWMELPRHSDSSDELAPMDWREAIEMASRSQQVEHRQMQDPALTDGHGRALAPVVRPGEVVIREANGYTWRRQIDELSGEEAWVRELRSRILEERMRASGMM